MLLWIDSAERYLIRPVTIPPIGVRTPLWEFTAVLQPTNTSRSTRNNVLWIVLHCQFLEIHYINQLSCRMYTKYESFSHCSYVYFICATCNFTVPLYSCCFYLPVVQLYNCLILLHCLMRKCVYAYYRTQSTAEGSVFGAVSLWFFVCLWNISGAAERICTKFTRKTCLVPRSDKFEGQAQRSRSPGTKIGIFGHLGGLRAVYVW